MMLNAMRGGISTGGVMKDEGRSLFLFVVRLQWTVGLVVAALSSSLLWPSSLITTTAAASCPYSRFGWDHTMCKYTPSACPSGVLIKVSRISCEEKDLILDLHNRLRQRVATGRVPGQPPARNMKRMVWDDELEALAKRWAEQCQVGHDANRDIGRFGVGQNVAATWTFSKEPKKVGREPEWDRLINGWFDEVTTIGFDPNHVESFKFNLPAGHYTQMVWANTYAIGCAYVYYRAKDTGYTKLYVCNYGPRGNVVGASMYEVSRDYGRDACRNAGERQSSYYNGLCETEGTKYPNHCEAENNIPRNEIVVLPPPSLATAAGYTPPSPGSTSTHSTYPQAGYSQPTNTNYFAYDYSGNGNSAPSSVPQAQQQQQQHAVVYRPSPSASSGTPMQQPQSQQYFTYQQGPAASPAHPQHQLQPATMSHQAVSLLQQQQGTQDVGQQQQPPLNTAGNTAALSTTDGPSSLWSSNGAASALTTPSWPSSAAPQQYSYRRPNLSAKSATRPYGTNSRPSFSWASNFRGSYRPPSASSIMGQLSSLLSSASAAMLMDQRRWANNGNNAAPSSLRWYRRSYSP